MGLFSRAPSSTEKKDINATISRVGTCFKRLESVDSIDKYFTEYDKFINDYNSLRAYEKQRIKFKYPLTKIYNEVEAEIPRIEKDVVSRGYDRMQRDAAKVTTEKSKKNKAIKFFDELEYYYPRLRPTTVEYIKSLKANCNLIYEVPQVAESENTSSSVHHFCTQCGAKLEDGATFCGKCGAKV